ncbi:hypothetical protein BDV96DRAFT_661639 [Lophiotrema nucula]|uniref:Uncharacterized protein n=1 Tax=Lophiotrema nucula TaxID=690887 RepID=A0A6A5Z280_9PLEO|nr:hypothetical protein BDV96DRAFT_661639 [Lophiotrema nucula]
MPWSYIPFALFPLVDINPEKVDELLEEARKGGGDVHCFWLAKENYDDAPKRETGKAHEGDAPPISRDYTSPFIGKKVEDVADWLRNKPDSTDLDLHHFAILDKTAQDGKIVICRIGGPKLKDQSDLDFMRLSALDGTQFLRGISAGMWEEAKEDYGKAKIEY